MQYLSIDGKAFFWHYLKMELKTQFKKKNSLSFIISSWFLTPFFQISEFFWRAFSFRLSSFFES